MFKKILITLSISLSTVINAATLAEFSHHPAKNPGNLIAVIDLSPFSLKWLALNKDFLITKAVPVVVLTATNAQAYKLIEQYPGLVAGAVPPPKELMAQFFEHVGIDKYPAVAEGHIIWQQRPNPKLFSPNSSKKEDL